MYVERQSKWCELELEDENVKLRVTHMEWFVSILLSVW